MAEIINIIPLDPTTFEFQEYSANDTSLITSVEVENSFNPTTDHIEYFVYDLNGNILTSNVFGYNGYRLLDNVLTIYPEIDLTTQGFTEGQYNTLYNFVSNKLASDPNNTYFLSQISPDRTEVRLDTTFIPNALVISSSIELTNNIVTSTGSYYDFYLDFGNNELVIANNILLDTSNINNPTILIKLYEALPQQFDINSQCWVVTQVANPVAYNINITQTFNVTDDNIYLKGPNTNLNIKNQINNSTDYSNINQLSATDLTQGSGSLRYQLNSMLADTGIEINIDYSNYDNFIHFSSAQTRLENFYYKLSLIEQYNYSASYSSTTSTNYYVSSSNVVWQAKIDEIITGFDNYEYFLYFDSGSASWPKTGSTPPYTNYSSTSIQGQAFLVSQSLVAEEYDIENNNALINAIPSYLLEDPANSQYELFIEMIGQHFDNIFLYTQDITNKYNNDNRLNYGVSKDLVADILRDMGIKIYQNNFSTNDLYSALLGLTPSGNLYNLPYTTGSLPTPAGYEYINTYITASSTSSLIPTEDLNDEIYKRIYANLPYLLKKKGTVEGLRALITLYGIPDTILQVNEFGGQNKIIENDYDLWFNQYNYAYYTSGSSYISSSFTLNSSWNADNNVPQAVEFRFKTDGLPQNTASVASQSLWETDQNISLVLKYTGSGYTINSYSGSSVNPYYQYAKLDFTPNPAIPSNTASVYLPFYEGGWWSVLVNKNSNVYTLYAKNKNYNGEDGNFIGFQASSSVTSAATSWNSSTKSYFGISSSLSGKYFTGSFQEVRYYVNTLDSSSFNDYVMNPYSIDSNGINTAPIDLAFRASLGGELYTSSISIHPKITGSWIATSSFTTNSSFYTSSGGTYIPNTEIFYVNQFPAGIKNRVSNKIRQQGEILPYSGSKEINLPTNQVLSPFTSIQQNIAVSGSYTPNIDYVEVAFSPQNEINNDIAGQLGYFNIGEYIGDPRLVSSSAESYPALDNLRNYYFEKYTGNYNIWDYIRLIKYFDNSLFKMIQDFTPARTNLASGIVIKQTTLERNKYPVPQPNIISSIANIGSGSTNIPYQTENILITGSPIQIYTVTGSTGGTTPDLIPDYTYRAVTASNGQTYTTEWGTPINPALNLTQSWLGSTPSLSGSVPFTQSTAVEFFNGELSGSVITVTNGELSNCNVTLKEIYTNSSLGTVIASIIPSGPQLKIPANIDILSTYYLTFSYADLDVGSSISVIDGSNRIYLTITRGPFDLATGNISLEIINPSFPLGFTSTDLGGCPITNVTLYQFYIEPDCLVLAGNVDAARANFEFFDVDFSSNQTTAVNANSIISASRGTGFATPSTVPASNYTIARIANPRYFGCKTISPTGSIYEGFVNQPMTTGSTIGALANVENYCNWFAYFNNITSDEIYYVDSGVSSNFLSASIVNITSLIDINGNVIDLSPINNIPLSGSITPNPLTSNVPLVNSIFPYSFYGNAFDTSSGYFPGISVEIRQYEISGSQSVISGSFSSYNVLFSGIQSVVNDISDIIPPSLVPGFNNIYGIYNETIVTLNPYYPSPKPFISTNSPGLLIPQNFNPKFKGNILKIAQEAGFLRNI